MPYADKEKQKEYQRNWVRDRPKIRQDRTKQRAEWLSKHKTPCVICGEPEKICIDFHHLDPSQKKFSVHSINTYGYTKTLEEIKKCVCVCANCHRKLHAGLVSLP